MRLYAMKTCLIPSIFHAGSDIEIVYENTDGKNIGFCKIFIVGFILQTHADA